MHYNEMHKLNHGSNAANEHNKILQERVKVFEQDIEFLRESRNEAQQKAREVTQANEILEKELIVYRTKNLKAEGDSHSSSATLIRLQTQLNGKSNDVDLLMHARTELEKALKTAKQKTIDVEKRSDELYRQLISTKENLDILTNEQKILSEELTLKQNELLKSEREKASKERELLELRPLKT